MRRITARALGLVELPRELGAAGRLIARALDLGVVALLLFIPTALGNRAHVDAPPAPSASIASYCDSVCSGDSGLDRASTADED